MTAIQLQSPKDLRHYSEALALRKVDDDPVVRRLRTAKQATWLLLLTCTFLFYYLIEKMQEALSMLV